MRRLGIALLALGSCAAPDDAPGGPDAMTPDDAGVDAMPRPDPGPSLGTFDLTYYWVAYEGDHLGGAATALYDTACTTLATVPGDFASAIALEGTGRLLDGRVLNVDGACGCPTSPCYVEVDDAHPWGYGVQGRALVPFRTVAVDASVISYGTGLYLPVLDGVTMPGDAPWGAFVHDGCVVAGDTGGGIVGMHVDFFAGLKSAYRTLDQLLALDALEVDDGGDRCADEP